MQIKPRTIQMGSIEEAINESIERNKLILECIEACEQMDTVSSEDYIDWAHKAAANLRAHLGWEKK